MRSLPVILGAGALLALVVEFALLSFAFDAQAVFRVADLSPWQRAFAYAGQFAKIGVLGLVIAVVLMKDRLADYWRELQDTIIGWRSLVFWPANLASYAVLFMLSGQLFGNPSTAPELTGFTCVAWLILAFATTAFWALSLVTPGFVGRFLRAEYVPLGVAAVIACVVWFMSLESQDLWDPMSRWTFATSTFLLELLTNEPVIVFSDEKLLGLGDFLVHVSAPCSGYEGIALITAFTALYLYIHREEVRFPQGFLLFPLGAAVIWLLNSARIAALVAMGHFWSADVAVGGFHSQAGWITFIAVSLLMLWLVGGFEYFRRNRFQADAAGMNVAVGTLIPIVVLLAVTLLTGALTAEFSWLYPARVIAVALAICMVRQHVPLVIDRIRWEPVTAGVFVAIVWVLMLGSDAAYNEAFSSALSSVPGHWAALWLLWRFVGAAITVPIAEELAFRGYLLSKLSGRDVTLNGRLPLSVFAVVVSSLAFGALHGAWLAGTAAGIVYAIVRLRSNSVRDAIVAHAVTNAVIFAYVLRTGNWLLI